MKYEISIIIPLYNNEEFLEQCLDTLLAQTFKDFEIIIVDDGSTDNSLKIARTYEEKHKFIKVLQQKNQYAGVARNLGMKHAQGEYLLFLDSDDFFETEMLEKIYNQAKKTDAEVVLFNGKKFDNITEEYTAQGYFMTKYLLPSREVFSASDEDIYILQITLPNPWTKLFKRSFIDRIGIQFPNTPHTEDYYFTTLALVSATKISYINEIFVNYRVNNQKSLEGNYGNEKLYIADLLERIYSKLKSDNLYDGNIRKTFINSAATTLLYNIKKLKTNTTKINFYNSELKQLIERLELFSFDKEYFITNNSKYAIQFIKNFVNGIEWAENRYKYLQPAETKVIHQAEINNSPSISVIIPVYNVEKYIEETLDSIVKQTFKHIEIICIDDGSTDSSLQIITSYAKKDNRISIIRQDNYGVSIARNNGVKYAKGEYIYFIDSDDLLKESALEKMYGKCRNDNLDILYFDTEVFYDSEDLACTHDGFKNYYNRDAGFEEVVTGVELLANMIQKKTYLPSPCLQIMKREFFIENECWFYPGILHEDNLYTYKSILKAERTSHINESFYLRRVRSNSIMTIEKNFDHVYGYFICFKEMMDIYEKLKNINEFEMVIISIPIKNIICNARDIFSNIDEKEKIIADFLEVKERLLIKNNIIDFSENSIKLKNENKRMLNENNKLKKQINRIRNHPIMKVRNKTKRVLKKIIIKK